MEFKEEEKLDLFKKIENLYFKKNFGSTSKSDLETLLFSEYLESRLKQGLDCDDYIISKELGITQARVRTLKERKELKYPYYDKDREDWWKEALAGALKNAKVDERDRSVKVLIPEVTLMNEIRFFIERAGWYDEISLNRKLLKLPLDCFVEIFIGNEEFLELMSNDVKKEIQEIAKQSENSEIKNYLNDLTKDSFKSLLLHASKETIGLMLQAIPFGGVAKTAFDLLSDAIIR